MRYSTSSLYIQDISILVLKTTFHTTYYLYLQTAIVLCRNNSKTQVVSWETTQRQLGSCLSCLSNHAVTEVYYAGFIETLASTTATSTS